MKIGMEMIDVMTPKKTTVIKIIRLVPVDTFDIVESVNIMFPEKIIIAFGWTLAFRKPTSIPSFLSLSVFS